jgi:hypothetical protein
MKQIITPRDRQNLSSGRWAVLKPQLPSDWRERLILIAPEYDSLRGADLLRRAHAGRCKDDRVLDIWERIVKDFKADKEKSKERKLAAQKRAKIIIPS